MLNHHFFDLQEQDVESWATDGEASAQCIFVVAFHDCHAKISKMFRHGGNRIADIHAQIRRLCSGFFRAVGDQPVRIHKIAIEDGIAPFVPGNGIVERKIGHSAVIGIRAGMFPEDVGQGMLHDNRAEGVPRVDFRIEVVNPSGQNQHKIVFNVRNVLFRDSIDPQGLTGNFGDERQILPAKLPLAIPFLFPFFHFMASFPDRQGMTAVGIIPKRPEVFLVLKTVVAS